MKKLVLGAFLLASMAAITSCKKSYSCECVTQGLTSTNVIINPITKVVAISEKMKEKQADASCTQTEDQMNALNTEIVNKSNSDYTMLETVCGIK